MIERILRLVQSEQEEKEIFFWSLLGPISLLCTISISGELDLLFMAMAGLYLTARFQKRGFIYSLILLVAGSLIRHAFIKSHHLWECGLEASLGVAFLISYLAFQQGVSFLHSLTTQVEAHSSSIKNLEEELVKEKEEKGVAHVAFQEKIHFLQKELDELQKTHSSILILNEVLRKTGARLTEEKETVSEMSLNQLRKIGELELNFQAASRELERLKNSSELTLENKQLQDELNASRIQKEQTHLINETLARLHAKECLKSTVWNEEKSKLNQELASLRNESEMLLKEAQTERNLLRERLSAEIQSLSEENGALREKLESLSLVQPVQMSEIAENERKELVEQLGFAHEKIKTLSQVDALFKQLKKQFEEKNQILHQTRSELFKTDTELQTLKMEHEQWINQPNPPDVKAELDLLSHEVTALEKENRDLQDLVTMLSKL